MNAYKFYIFLGILLSPIFLLAQSSHKPTIVLDAGHGGKDPGTLNKRAKEKTITLKIAKKVGELLAAQMPEAKISYTRDADVFVELDTRATKANRQRADIFVSIHVNSCNAKGVAGTEIYYFPPSNTLRADLIKLKQDSLAAGIDDPEEKASFKKKYQRTLVMSKTKSATDYAESMKLAKLMDEHLHAAGRKTRGTRSAKYVVLGLTNMPAVLVEVGYLTNPNEETFMSSEVGQAKLATGITNAILEYYKKGSVPKKSTPAPPLLADAKKTPSKIPVAAPAPTPKSTIKTPPPKPTPATSAKTTAPKTAISAPKTTDTKVVYVIQLGVLSQKADPKSPKWAVVKNLKTELREGKYLHYSTGYQTLEEAIKVKNELQKKGFPDAFIPLPENWKARQIEAKK
jgi:N-acetylmuramoyl-L-alanine amidase